MVVRNISEAKAELSALIARVQQGDEVILAKAGKPVAKLVLLHRGRPKPRPRFHEGGNLDRARFRSTAGRYGGGLRLAGTWQVNFLLDTHLLLWWLSNSSLLPAQARRLIADPDNTIFVSAVNHWEVALKSSIGKLRVPSGFSEKLTAEQFAELPLRVKRHSTGQHEWHHHPDHVFIAQPREVEPRQTVRSPPMAAWFGSWPDQTSLIEPA